jgi:hypothetical protein
VKAPQKVKLAQRVAKYRFSSIYCELESQLEFFRYIGFNQAIGKWYTRYGCSTHLHQRKASRKKLRQSINNMRKTLRIGRYKDFEALHGDVLLSLRPSCWKNGWLYYYDAALRIGVSKGVYPDKFLYFHRGTREGLLKLRKHKLIKTFPVGGFRMLMNELPKPIQKLGSIHAENFLCFYNAGKF